MTINRCLLFPLLVLDYTLCVFSKLCTHIKEYCLAAPNGQCLFSPFIADHAVKLTRAEVCLVLVKLYTPVSLSSVAYPVMFNQMKTRSHDVPAGPHNISQGPYIYSKLAS